MNDITPGSGNVYADIGLPDAQEMEVKAQLAASIASLLGARKLTQAQAAKVLGLPQPRVSALLRGQFRGISEAKMRECLNRLGQDVEIVLRTASAGQAAGRTRVVQG